MPKNMDQSIKLLDIKIDKLRERRNGVEELETQEGVLDKYTLETLYYMAKRRILTEINGVISTGKEANVYWGKNIKLDYAVKIFRTSTANFKAMQNYIRGDPRFKKIRRGTRPLIYAWALKEYKNLQRARAVGVRVPEPISIKNNVLVMEFIGSGGRPAPLLKNAVLDSAQETYNEIYNFIKILYRRARLVHADLSEFNVMYNGVPILIDMSQSVLTSHPMAMEYLKRDISVISKFFRSRNVDVPEDEKQFKDITGGVA